MVKETTKIWLYTKSPFKNDYANVIHFSTPEQQRQFFEEPNQHITLVYSSSTYQYLDRNGSVFVSGRVEQFESVTYMRFINNGRTYYAFVYDVLYENEGTTRVIYEIDVWNTYQQEMKQAKIMGHVEQETKKNVLSAIMDGQQGFQVGTKYASRAGKIGIDVEWLVIVAKPTIKLSTKEKRADDMSFSGMQKAFKYFVLPIDIDSAMTMPFEYKGKKYPAYNLENIYKYLFGIKGGESGTVNNIVNMYVTRDAGIEYKIVVDGSDKIVKITDKFLQAKVAELGQEETRVYRPSASSGSGISSGSMSRDDDISTEEKRVRLVTRLIKELVPNATANGIAGIVGNFSIEGRVTAKKYECDWLTNYQYDKMANEPTAENLVGSWSAFESMYSISLYEAGYLHAGKHYIGIGIGQWTGPRSKALIDYAKSNNKDVWAFSTQFSFMNQESKASTFQRIASSSASASDNAIDFMRNWEGVAYKQAERVASANQWLPTIQDELK